MVNYWPLELSFGFSSLIYRASKTNRKSTPRDADISPSTLFTVETP